MVYAERAEPALLANNRTPRGLVLNLGGDVWACFDLDLLRVAAVWEGEEAKTYSNAAYSYYGAWPGQRLRSARMPLAGDAVWFANGLYPGWQVGTAPALHDPRAPGPDPAEIGRGPLAEDHGRFHAVRLMRGGVRLEYGIAGAIVGERISRVDHSGRPAIERRIRITATSQPLVLVLAVKPAKLATADVMAAPPGIAASLAAVKGDARSLELIEHDDVWAVRVAPRREPVEFRVTLTRSAGPVQAASPDRSHAPLGRRTSGVFEDDSPAPVRWPEELTTTAVLSTEPAAYVVDDIPLPLHNPWRRNVRVADVQFFSDGTAAALTFDGDVWMVRGLNGDLETVRWRRFTSGLHEPLSMVIRDDELFVFDRNGIWRLRDANGDGEADGHELFTNAFAQTFTLNEYSNTMKLAPDGSFIIAKKSATRVVDGPGNGTVLRLSPDGRTSTILGWGFRQPFIGVDPLTGMVTASDQEGNYVPATPLYVVRDGTYHGFLGPTEPKETYPAPIDEPLTWMPRTGSASGVTQVWLRKAKMGPLNGSLIHVSYNRPELFVVRLNERQPRTQAAVISLTRNFDFSPIGATVNPADGQLYVAGFRIYGSGAKRISGLARVRYTGRPPVLPREIVPMKEGVLLRFDVELAANTATVPANYSVERWNYRRSAAYGSPHYKLDGSKGQDRMHPSSVYLSKDRKSVFLGLPDMRSDVMQMQVGWRLTAGDGSHFENRAHFTPFVLGAFAPAAEGFDDVPVDLTPRRPADTATDVVASRAEGERLYQAIGCVACHTTNGAAQLGPTWRGLFGSRRRFTDESGATADEAYLRESILEPHVRVVPGFEAPMPSYAGILDDTQIESLVMYIKSLQ